MKKLDLIVPIFVILVWMALLVAGTMIISHFVIKYW